MVCDAPSDGICDANLTIDTQDSNDGIDPWSAVYWEPEPQPAADTAAKMPPPPNPANAFAALTGTATVKTVKPEILDGLKKAILDNKGLSKAGIVDYIFQQFRDSASRIEVKNTIEMVAEKRGTGKVKEWALKPDHGIST